MARTSKRKTYPDSSQISNTHTNSLGKSLIRNLNQKLTLDKNFKSQSAMEYLMTYGWAILIIAIVMIAMFSLGIFNPSEPRVTTGSCEVYRSISSSPGLTGECQGVWPEYVAKFNGATSNIKIGTSSSTFVDGNQITIVVWGEKLGPGNLDPAAVLFAQYYSAVNICNSNSKPYAAFYTSTTNYGVTGPGSCIPINEWAQYIITYNGVDIQLYVNGVSGGPSPATGTVTPGQIAIGSQTYNNLYFNGLISNVQLYNTSLSQSEITALYQEGIGGAPIDPLHIVGWWPLNGNAQDYSGNNNQGTATAISYLSAWTSGYTQP